MLIAPIVPCHCCFFSLFSRVHTTPDYVLFTLLRREREKTDETRQKHSDAADFRRQDKQANNDVLNEIDK